jgi:glycosyltransferase involved in cell wall biosynthesis
MSSPLAVLPARAPFPFSGGRRGLNIGISTLAIQRGETGVAQYVFALVRALLADSAGHEFTLFVLEEDTRLFDFAQGRARLERVAEHFRPPLKNIWWHQTALPELAARHRLDVAHVPTYRRLPWPKPCALVATIHDLAPFRLAGKYDWTRMAYGRFVVPRLARRQDEIIAVSQTTARDITACLGVRRERVSVVHNGLEHARFFPGSRLRAASAVAQAHGLGKPYFLYVARLEHPGKNHVRLITAFNRFKAATRSDWQLVLAGRDWHGAEHIHGAIRQSPFAPDIRCLGFVPDSGVPDLYRTAGAFVYPSLFEGFGMPPVEAMACGCPVISSGRGALAEVVGDAAALVEPEDVDSLTAQLCSLATDDVARARWRKAGLERAARFDWANTAAGTLRVYERAAAMVRARG